MTGWQRFARIALIGAAALVLVALVILVREAREPVHRAARGEARQGEVKPLTDVAAQPRRFPFPMESYAPGASPGRPAGAALPVAHPIPAGKPGGPLVGPTAPARQWSRPLATPGPPRPPDPFHEPEIAQDPDRGRPRPVAE